MLDKISVIVCDNQRGYIDFCIDSIPDQLYRWTAAVPGYVWRIKTLREGSRNPLRGRKKELAAICAEQAYLTKLTYVYFDVQFKPKN